MTNHKPLWYLICYDIRDAKRLGRVHRYLRRHALMLQESVYLFYANQADANKLRRALTKRISCQTDDMRLYQLAASAELQFYARLPWGPDILYSDLPAHKLQAQLQHAER